MITYEDLLKRSRRNGECIEWTGANRGKTGYGSIRVGRKVVDVHRLTYLLVKGDPGNFLVCHSCDNRLCFNPDHLFLGTYQDNYDDAVKKGRIVKNVISEKGLQNLCKHFSAVTMEQAIIIKNSDKPQKELIKEFGVSRFTISRIKHGKTWKFI